MYVHLKNLFSSYKTNLHMKKISFFAVIATVVTTLSSFIITSKKVEDVYNVNTSNSRIDWIGSKKDGYHPGYLTLKSGNVSVEAGKIKGGKFVIDVANLKVTDAAGAKLEGHLKSADFFNVEKFPEASFEITTVNYTSDNVIEIAGNLTVKGNTVPLKFPGYVRNVDDKKLFAQAFFTVDANLLGIASKWVNADVPLSIHLFATK